MALTFDRRAPREIASRTGLIEPHGIVVLSPQRGFSTNLP
jgi:hypothetical protein